MVEGEAGASRPTRVMIVDDDPLTRYALRVMVESVEGMVVVAEAAGAQDAAQKAAASAPDVALIDIQMAGMDGLKLTRGLVEQHPALKALVVSVFPGDPYAIEALRKGACGYLTKEHVPTHLQEAIRAVSHGLTYLRPSVAPGLLRRILQPDRTAPAPSLTAREREVLRLLGQGLSNKEIAGALGATVRTVKAHVSRILQKLNVQARTQAAILAVRMGLAERPQDGSLPDSSRAER